MSLKETLSFGVMIMALLIFSIILSNRVKDLSVKVEQCVKDTKETKADMKSYLKFFDGLEGKK